jgi:hypothetical protein
MEWRNPRRITLRYTLAGAPRNHSPAEAHQSLEMKKGRGGLRPELAHSLCA